MIRKEYKENEIFSYVEYFPEEMKEGLPIVFQLHGAGERGRNIDHLYRHAIPAMIKDGIEIPAVVLYPQCPGQFIWNNMVKELKEIIEKVESASFCGLEKELIFVNSLFF